MSTGEVKLGNGKIMGHRKWKRIYDQKPRPIDDRECILINKLAVEFRRLKAITNGETGPTGTMSAEEFKGKKTEFLDKKTRDLKMGLHFNRLQYHFRDPTAHL